MKILVLLSHPAQFLFFKYPLSRLKQKGHSVYTLIKTKDILSELLDSEGWEYYNILPRERGTSGISIIKSLIVRDIKILRFAKKHKINLIAGTDASLSHVAKVLGIPSITTLEDDYKVIKNLALLTYPFTQNILTPEICDVDKWIYKKTGYNGYMKLSYLHPGVFKPNMDHLKIKPDNPYFLIRLSALSAHHDSGEKGINNNLLKDIISKLEKKGLVFISSEKKLPLNYDKYILKIPVQHIHHYLYYAQILICDSQSMAVEAAMLGTPSVRISSFSGHISVLEELEHKYKLTYGIQPDEEAHIMNKIDELLNMKNLKDTFKSRRQRMLNDKIDVASFLTWYLENYPESRNIMKENPNYQYKFK